MTKIKLKKFFFNLTIFFPLLFFLPAAALAAAPVLDPVGNKAVGEGSNINFTLNATDADGDTLTYSAGNLPAGATFTPSTKKFNWTPGYSQAGTYPGVHFEVSDGTSTDFEDITITVTEVDSTPAFNYSTEGYHIGYPDELLKFSVKAVDPDGDPVTYTDPADLPSGATIDQTTRTLSWTPSNDDVEKQFDLTFKATDGKHTEVSVTVRIFTIEKKPAVDICAGLPPAGSQSGPSCTTWAIGYYQRTYAEGKEKGWDVKDKKNQCSPGFLFSQNPYGTGSGMSFTTAYDLMSRQGCALVDAKATGDYSYPSISQFENALPMKISGRESIYGLKNMKSQLQNGEVLVGSYATYSNWYSTNGGNDVYDGPRGGTSVGAHALAICGYDDERTYTDAAGLTQKGAFKLVNSWGSTWSEDGFFWMSYNAVAYDDYNWAGIGVKMKDLVGFQVLATSEFEIVHPASNSLSISVGVGNPSSPQKSFQPYRAFYKADWKQSIEINDGAGYLPPDNTTNKWFIKVTDTQSGGTGTLDQFSIKYDGNVYSATGLPAAIPDNDSNGLVVYLENSQPNNPPTQPASVVITPASPKTTDNLVCTASGSTDADNDPITYKYAWYKNDVLQGSLTTNTVNNSLTAKGEVWKCVATPNDTKQDGPSAETQTTIVNSSPVMSEIGNQQTSEGSLLTFSISATDADGDTLTYSAANLPAGAAFDPAAKTFSWTPDYSQAGTYSGVQFKASDGTNESSREITLTVTNVNRSPLLNEIPDQIAGTGELFSLQVLASDPDSDPLAYSAADLPEGATFDPATQTLSWTPTEAQPGEHLISFSVSDGTLSDTKTVKITVIIREDSSVAIISPKDKETLTGSITVEAQVAEPSHLASLQFQLDGENMGAEVTGSPYTVSLDTTLKTNGSHALRVLMRKTGGELVVSKIVSVTFSNEKIPPVITSAYPPKIVPFGASCLNLSVTANEETSCKYSTGPNTAYDAMTGEFSKLPVSGVEFGHEAQVCGLKDENTYSYYVRCQDLSRNINSNDFVISFTIGKVVDVNKDNSLDTADIEILKQDFLKLTANLSNPRSDINQDGQTTIKDVGIMMSEWE